MSSIACRCRRPVVQWGAPSRPRCPSASSPPAAALTPPRPPPPRPSRRQPVRRTIVLRTDSVRRRVVKSGPTCSQYKARAEHTPGRSAPSAEGLMHTKACYRQQQCIRILPCGPSKVRKTPAHRSGASAADDVLPHVAQLLDAHGLDQEVHRAVRHAAKHRAGLPIRRHHCAVSAVLLHRSHHDTRIIHGVDVSCGKLAT